MHDPTFDAVEYLPASHAEHDVAPGFVPVLVFEPAAHSVHAATLDAVEYEPAAHAVHVVAPVLLPVSVIDPAAHVMHEATFDATEYSPAAQAMQLHLRASPFWKPCGCARE